jgi:hypothetical protein
MELSVRACGGRRGENWKGPSRKEEDIGYNVGQVLRIKISLTDTGDGTEMFIYNRSIGREAVWPVFACFIPKESLSNGLQEPTKRKIEQTSQTSSEEGST